MEEFYYELIIRPKNHLEVFKDFLLEITQNALQEDKNSLIVRATEPLDDIFWATEEFAKKLNIPIKTNLEKKRNEDWINNYKNSIKPIEVGSFYIRPEWEEKKENLTNIIINPALAFGSGHHETTYSCLQAIDKYITKDATLLDVGCGSGILSIAAYKKGAIVSICDTDEVATQSAVENFSLNDAQIDSFWTGSANKSDKTYDFVIANIIADVIIMIEKELKMRVKNGGILILSGIIDKYLNKVLEKFNDFDLLLQINKDEWHTLVLRKV